MQVSIADAYSPQQRQHLLGRLIGLGQHGHGGLLHDLVACQVGGLGRVVGVHDAAAGLHQVLVGRLQVGCISLLLVSLL